MRFRSLSLGQYQVDHQFRKARILRVEQDAAVLSCAFCQGKGWGQAFGRCPICGGRGEVTVAEPFRRCRFCAGIGRSQRSATYVCTVCRGKGAVMIPEEHEDCPACGGKGKRRGLPCMPCKGIGAIQKSQEVSDGHR